MADIFDAYALADAVTVLPATTTWSYWDYWDYWGTQVTCFELMEPHGDLVITAVSLVETEPAAPLSQAPGWTEIADQAATSRLLEFSMPTARTTVGPEPVAAAHEVPTVGPYLLPTVLRLVRDRYPALELQVHEEQTASLLEGLGAGRLDLLLLAVPLGVQGVTELPLFDEDFVLVTPRDHWLAGRIDVPREALRELDLLLEEGHCLRDQALDVCREAGRREGAATTSAAGLSTLVQLVAGGLGVTLLPRTAVQVEAGRSANLATAYFAHPAPSRRIALVMRAGAARAEELESFASALRDALRPLPVRFAC